MAIGFGISNITSRGLREAFRSAVVLHRFGLTNVQFSRPPRQPNHWPTIPPPFLPSCIHNSTPPFQVSLKKLRTAPAPGAARALGVSFPISPRQRSRLHSHHGFVLVVTSNRIGLPSPLNRKSTVKPVGSEILGSHCAACTKLPPYDLIALATKAADMTSETPQMRATITDVFFIKCPAAWHENPILASLEKASSPPPHFFKI